MKKLLFLITCTILLLGFIPLQQVGAQTNSQFFPETGFTVSGRFLEYWRSNGGLAVFGYPLSAQADENGREVQYFERQRFELHPENARPYDVLLGLLGSERLSSGAPAPTVDRAAPGCQYFVTTRHSLCNQQGNTGFLSYWRSNGLEFDGRPGKSYEESLALFGYPISEAYDYTLVTGEQVYAQWFERARFEWHPNNPNPYKVLLGRLGAEARGTTPAPALVDRVQIFLIGPNSGSVGCGDSVVGVTRQIAPTATPLRAALDELFALKSRDYGQSGLYNALYQSDLRADRVVIVNGRAEISLSGTLRLAGVCDEPRVVAQIESTVRQFSSVTSTLITLNGVPLAEAVRG
jgi:hypothetical protein